MINEIFKTILSGTPVVVLLQLGSGGAGTGSQSDSGVCVLTLPQQKA